VQAIQKWKALHGGTRLGRHLQHAVYLKRY